MKRHINNEQNYDLELGKRIRLIREHLGISQQRLSQMIGVTFQQIQKYEKGQNRITVSRLASISEATQTSITEFLPQLPNTNSHLSEAELRLLNTLSRHNINIDALNDAFTGENQ